MVNASTGTSVRRLPAAGGVLVLVVGDALLVGLAAVIAVWMRLGEWPWDTRLDGSWLKVLVIAAIVQVCLWFAGLYNPAHFADRGALFSRILHALAAVAVILAFVYYFIPALILGRGVFLVMTLVLVNLVTGFRIAFDRATRHTTQATQD